MPFTLFTNSWRRKLPRKSQQYRIPLTRMSLCVLALCLRGQVLTTAVVLTDVTVLQFDQIHHVYLLPV